MTVSNQPSTDLPVERRGEFRVYRVVESVPHLNLQRVDEPRLYTVYRSGYDEATQEAVDDLRTGDRVSATLVGDPDADEEPWRVERVDRDDGVATAFAVDVDPPGTAVDAWAAADAESAGDPEPSCRTILDDGEPVGACCVQPRDPLPNGAFVPTVLAGLLPLESQFAAVPGVGDPAAEALFLDPDPPDATTYESPYGVVLLFTAAGAATADRFREAYDLPRDTDTRPDFDPYGV
ncbi:hypothetical protein RYH80_17765 [Halobaculum sp. MBLA0147]|uniref:hypothetical protein n=1 Tax=Halobaculum sp. MBLA0147 TaxID=3079934 RepID=UPI00352378F9